MTAKAWHVFALCMALLVAACGTVATPFPGPGADVDHETETVEPEDAVVAVPTDVPTEAPTEVLPTAIPTEAPTSTPLPPTLTPLPPTETPLPPEPTAVEAEAGTSVDPESVGDAASGEQLFMTGGAAGVPCSSCHHANSETTLVGPGLLNVGARAETRVEGQTAVEYLHESIVDPNAFVVAGFVAGMMPDIFDVALSEDQISDLVAYLLTLEG